MEVKSRLDKWIILDTRILIFLPEHGNLILRLKRLYPLSFVVDAAALVNASFLNWE